MFKKRALRKKEGDEGDGNDDADAPPASNNDASTTARSAGTVQGTAAGVGKPKLGAMLSFEDEEEDGGGFMEGTASGRARSIANLACKLRRLNGFPAGYRCGWKIFDPVLAGDLLLKKRRDKKKEKKKFALPDDAATIIPRPESDLKPGSSQRTGAGEYTGKEGPAAAVPQTSERQRCTDQDYSVAPAAEYLAELRRTTMRVPGSRTGAAASTQGVSGGAGGGAGVGSADAAAPMIKVTGFVKPAARAQADGDDYLPGFAAVPPPPQQQQQEGSEPPPPPPQQQAQQGLAPGRPEEPEEDEDAGLVSLGSSLRAQGLQEPATTSC